MYINKEKLDIILARKIMTIKRLSVESGVSIVTIIRIRNGTQKARPETIGKIAKVLGCDVSDIVGEG